MGGGAWPFLVGGVICLVNSDNERDLILLNSYGNIANSKHLLVGSLVGLTVDQVLDQQMLVLLPVQLLRGTIRV